MEWRQSHRESWLQKIVRFGAGLVIGLALLTGLTARPAEAGDLAQRQGGGSAAALLQAVNAVRTANGLAPFQANSALMAAAQAQSEYQASIDSTTHVGRGGSDVRSRAIAAGYGGGANVSVIENVYGGMDATPQQAVNWWKGDGVHLATLLSTRHTDAGAGAAVSNSGVVYYTLVVGAISGGNAAENGSAATPASSGSGTSSATSAPAFSPIQISTPNADGAVIHVVQPGETLWAISAAYKINILDLLNQNGLNANAFIIPGQKIVIRPVGTEPTATATLEATAEKPTRTPRPTATLTPAATEQADLSQPTPQAPTAADKSQALERVVDRSGIDPLLVLIAGLMAGGLALMVVGNILKRAG